MRDPAAEGKGLGPPCAKLVRAARKTDGEAGRFEIANAVMGRRIFEGEARWMFALNKTRETFHPDDKTAAAML